LEKEVFFPNDCDPLLKSFIQELLLKNPDERLKLWQDRGSLTNHPFLREQDLTQLFDGTIEISETIKKRRITKFEFTQHSFD